MPSKTTHYDVDLVPRVSGYANATYPVRATTRDWFRTWTTTAGYAQKKRTFSELPTNPLDEQSFDRKHVMSSVRLDKWVGGANPIISVYIDFTTGHWLPPQVTAPTTAHTALYNKCVAGLPKKINGTQFNSLVFMAELRKTREMVSNLVKDISLAFDKKQRDRTENLSKLSPRAYYREHGMTKRAFRSESGLNRSSGLTKRELQNVWLEYRYGWRLLVKDIHDALASVHDLRTKRPVFRVEKTAFEGATSTFPINHLQLTDRYAPPGQVLNDLSVTRVTRSEVTIKVRYRDSFPLLGTLQQYGITNPALLVWELIPYSFVFDWLVPVADYLSTIDTFVGKEFVSGSVSYVHDDTVVSEPANVRVDPANSGWVLGKKISVKACTSKRRTYKRVALTTFPSASLPSLDVSLNSQRLIDAVSLVTQRIRR